MLELITILTGSIGLAVILYLTGYLVEVGSKLKIAGNSYWNPIETKPFLQRLDYMAVGLFILEFILFLGGFMVVVLSYFYPNILGIITSIINYPDFELTNNRIWHIMLLSVGLIYYYLFCIVVGYLTTKNDYFHKITYSLNEKNVIVDCEMFDETSDFIYAIFKEDKCLHAIPKKNIIELCFGKSKEKNGIQKIKEKPKKKKKQN
ncbi:MAG: hypothetical protein KAI26_04245 [Nanoarchaeota archaeon]|nr:hypothetical protein [Nanoarchaeota archaeon]